MARWFDQGRPNGFDAAGAPDADVAAETERLLSQRTRDIVLKGAIRERYRAQSWNQRSKIVRAWMIWVTGLSLAAIGINAVVVPELLWLSLVVSGFVVPLTCAVVYLIWSRPRPAATEGLSIVVWIATAMIAYSSLGAAAGGFDHERYVTVTLFVATIGLMVLGIEIAWTAAMAVVALLVYLVANLVNPTIEWPQALAMTAFYGLGLYATVVARRTATILSQRSFLMAMRDKQRREALAEANRRLEELAAVDPLTGIANRRSAMSHIERIWADAGPKRAGVAMIMADIDHFKRLNDSLGHAAGDECIQKVAKAIESSIRIETDIVSRHGGEEFLVVLTGATRDLADAIAERIRCNVEALGIGNPGAPGGIVTLSLGIAFAQDGARPELVTKWADDALYEAKRQGRNRVRSASSPAAMQWGPQAGGYDTRETPGAAVARLA